MFKTDKQQGPTVWHMELCSILGNNLNGKRIERIADTCGCITDSLCCTRKTNTTVDRLSCGGAVVCRSVVCDPFVTPWTVAH